LTTKINEDIANAVASLSADIQQKVKEITDAYTNAIKSAKEEITAAYTKAIQNAINALDASLKSWVGEQLSNYYTIAQIDAMLATLTQEMNGKLEAQKAYLEGLINELSAALTKSIADNKVLIDALRNDVTTLQGESAEHASKIVENATAISTNAQSIINNATAIAKNGEDIEANEKLIADNKALIEANTKAIAENKSAIETLKSSTSTSIAKNATDITQNASNIAKNAALISQNSTAIANNQLAISHNATDIAQLQQDLVTTKSDITEAYKKAINDAITTNNGVIDTKIAAEVSTLNTRISNEVATINNAINALKSRVATLENEVNAIKQQIANILSEITDIKEDLAKLLARIQSISYIPTYDDGKATVKYNGNTSRVTLDFEVSPKDAVVELAKVWENAISLKAVYTQTRAVSFIDMPIISFEADTTNGIISVTASAENLSEGFFNGTQSASTRLSISDGNNSVVSDYVPMTAKWEAYNSNTNTVLIKFAEDMNLIAEHPDASVELISSVNMKDVEWIPINFSGTFNGNSDKGYEIKSLSAPLFENISGTVKNLQISVDITKTSAVQLGGLANSSNGIVDNCDVSGKISMTAMSESNTSYISGVVGLATAGSLSNLINNCSINVVGSTSNNKDVNITGVAHSNVDMTNCVNNGDLYADGTFTRVGVSGITSPRQAGVKIICCENRGKLEFDGTATKIWLGGISAHVHEGPIEYIGCKNSGEITYTAGAITNRGDVEIAGVLAYSNNRSTIEGCCNEGTIDVKGQVVYGKLFVAGICANSMANTFIQNSTFYPECSSYNKGKISVSATRYKELYVGGGIGCANGNQTKGGNTIIDSFVNYSCIDIAPHIINTATYVYIGGCVGKMDGDSELFANASLSNIGDIIVEDNINVLSPQLFVGGIVGYSDIVVSNCQAYCNIKAIGLEGMAGMIMGQARAEATKAINCQVGGTLVFVREEIPGVGGKVTYKDTPGALDETNWYDHIYSAAVEETVATGDGCEYLAIKPSLQ
jgi:hypothetical protein